MAFRFDQSGAISSLFEKDCEELMRDVYYDIAFPHNQEISISETPSIIYCVPNGPKICLMGAYRRPVDQSGNTGTGKPPLKVPYNMRDGVTKEALNKLAKEKGVVGAVGDLRKRVVMWFDVLRTDPLDNPTNKVDRMPDPARWVWDDIDNKYPDRHDIPSGDTGLETMPNAKDSNLPPVKRG